MLEPILCGPLAWAPLLPKLRGHFAEFLDNASPAGLRILSSSTCVGLRYGRMANNSGFSRQEGGTCFTTLVRSTSRLRLMHSGFACCATTPFVPDFPFPAHVSLPCPHSSVTMRYRNINLLSIGYAFQPHLRSRLSQGRSALPWRPWIFGHKDSHLVLATHSGILSS